MPKIQINWSNIHIMCHMAHLGAEGQLLLKQINNECYLKDITFPANKCH